MAKAPPLCSFLVAALALVVSSAAQSVPDERFYYKLTTAFQGPNLAMTVWDDGALTGRIRMENYTGRREQLFRFIAEPNFANSYRISSLARGVNLPIGIENGGARNNQPRLVPRAARSGQIWFFTQNQVNPPYRRMTTLFRGPGLSLEGAAGPNQDMPELLPTGPFGGQAWLFTPVRTIVPPDVFSFSAPCAAPGSQQVVLGSAFPEIGRNLRIDARTVFSFEQATLAIGVRRNLPLDLGFLGAPGCSYEIDSFFQLPMT